MIITGCEANDRNGFESNRIKSNTRVSGYINQSKKYVVGLAVCGMLCFITPKKSRTTATIRFDLLTPFLCLTIHIVYV
jgi:hypothetical protein